MADTGGPVHGPVAPWRGHCARPPAAGASHPASCICTAHQSAKNGTARPATFCSVLLVIRQFGKGGAGVSKEACGLLGQLFGRDVTGDLRCADDLAVCSLDRRDRQGHIDRAAVFPQPLRLKMFDPLASLEPLP